MSGATLRLSGLFLFPGLIFASVINNQIGSDLRLLGAPINALTAAAACVLLLSAARPRLAALYIAATFGGYLAARYTGIRAPYETLLNALYLIAAAHAARLFLPEIRKEFVVITLASGAVMLLQVLGVGEWTQTLAQHGIITETYQIPKTAHPTLFVSVTELMADQLQGRPGGSFTRHSSRLWSH